MTKTTEELRAEWLVAQDDVWAAEDVAWAAADMELMDAATSLAEKAEDAAWGAYRAALEKEQKPWPIP